MTVTRAGLTELCVLQDCSGSAVVGVYTSRRVCCNGTMRLEVVMSELNGGVCCNGTMRLLDTILGLCEGTGLL